MLHCCTILYVQSFLRDSDDEGEFKVHQPTMLGEESTTAESADMEQQPDHVAIDTNEEMITGAHPQQPSDIKNDTIAEEGDDKDEQDSPPNQHEQLPHSTETTPVGTPHKPRPSSPPTSTASGSPASSIAGSMKGRRMSKAIVGKIQKEFESREKKLKHDLEEVKVKSRKAVTSLKAQLANAHTRHESEMEAMKREMKELEEHLEQVERENASLSEEVEGVRRENEELALSLRDRESEVYR